MGLFEKKENNDEGIDIAASDIMLSNKEAQTIQSEAQQQSVMQGGNSVSFKTGLEDEFSKFSQETLDNKLVQDELHKGTKLKMTDKEGKKGTLIKQKDQLENKVLKEINDGINKIEQEIIDAPNDSKKYGIPEGPDPSTKALFSIGCIILAAVGVFLAIFYMSASYSAFFKDWGLESTTEFAAKIFDSNAFAKAWQKGVGAGLLVSLTVFIFLGLGVLLHVFQKEKGKLKWFKISVVIIITFIFDCLIAYFIEDGVYQINYIVGQPIFDIYLAFKTLGFWLIIFFGFVTYIIWGLVFDFTMDKWSQFSPLLVFIKGREKAIKRLKFEKKEIIKKINILSNEIGELEVDISVLNEKLKISIIPVSRFKHIHSAYSKGWIFGIAACAINDDIKDKRRFECQKVAEDFISELNKEE